MPVQDEPSYIGSVLSMVLVAISFSCLAYQVGKQVGVREQQKEAISMGYGQIIRDAYGNERFGWKVR